MTTLQLSKPTVDLLSALDAFSGHKLTRQDDLGILIELAFLLNRPDALEELCFHSKFVSKAYGMLQRLGKDDKGYESLTQEFTTAVEKSRALIDTLLSASPAETKRAFSYTYLQLTKESLQNLLSLCYDLSWYKNWLIDRLE
jgi:hypothetical protein